MFKQPSYILAHHFMVPRPNECKSGNRGGARSQSLLRISLKNNVVREGKQRQRKIGTRRTDEAGCRVNYEISRPLLTKILFVFKDKNGLSMQLTSHREVIAKASLSDA